MFLKRMASLALVATLAFCLCGSVMGAEVDCDSVYCFQVADFGEEKLVGICITGLPDSALGTVMLGTRVLRCGDILTAEQVKQMTFTPLQTELDREATVTYLPIYENRVEKAVTATISIHGKRDQPPVAEDSAVETYKNLPNEGKLKAYDPEGKGLVYTVTRQPKRGTVQVNGDGSFVYTPKKNKVGVDSFVYTVTDPAGNVSREATVTVTILKLSNATFYTDTEGSDCRFEAEWMKNTGLFVGEQIGGESCFGENRSVTKGEFLTMLVKALNIPVEETAEFSAFADQVPNWLKPYLAAAVRAGLTAGVPLTDSGMFGLENVITGAEAAVMLQNAMDLSVTTAAEEWDEDLPEWAAAAVMAMNENGIAVNAGDELTRGQVAVMLYQVSRVAENAPGLRMYQ